MLIICFRLFEQIDRLRKPFRFGPNEILKVEVENQEIKSKHSSILNEI